MWVAATVAEEANLFFSSWASCSVILFFHIPVLFKTPVLAQFIGRTNALSFRVWCVFSWGSQTITVKNRSINCNLSAQHGTTPAEVLICPETVHTSSFSKLHYKLIFHLAENSGYFLVVPRLPRHWNQCGSQDRGQRDLGFKDSRVAHTGNYGTLPGQGSRKGLSTFLCTWHYHLAEKAAESIRLACKTLYLGYGGREVGWELVEERVEKTSHLYLCMLSLLSCLRQIFQSHLLFPVKSVGILLYLQWHTDCLKQHPFRSVGKFEFM